MTRIFDNLREQEKLKPKTLRESVSGWRVDATSRVLMDEGTWNRLVEWAEVLRPPEPYFCPRAD